MNWIEYYEQRQDAMLDRIKMLAEHESFTAAVEHVNRLADTLESQINALSPDALERIKQEEVADCLLAKWFTDVDAAPFLILCHMDTVHPIGTLKEFPVEIKDGKLYGPGTLDMKAGITTALFAIQALIETGTRPAAPIWLLITSDEENGSLHSRELIEKTATGCDLVLTMEPGLASGDIKAWRKGGGTYYVHVTGKPSHAGIEPEAGINAVVELAKQVVLLDSFNDLKYGTSVSVTTISGGTATNVIPARATAAVDFRATDQLSFQQTNDKIMNLTPNMPGAKVDVVVRTTRPPMEFNEGNQYAVEQAKAIASQMNIPLKADGTGGMSDANFTSTLGIPTLDGLGPVGGGAHTLEEFISIYSLPRRAALFTGLLTQYRVHK